jgi:TM2 domain-containing membrane protein YozV
MMGNVVTRQIIPPEQTGASPGAGFPNFRAAALAAPAVAVQAAFAAAAAPAPPPPPPPLAGSGIAPPPMMGPAAQAVNHARAQLVSYYQAPQPKTRVIFVLLGIFLGIFGVHNFYAGYAKKGAMQLVATVLIAIYSQIAAWLWLVVWLWAIVEICTVNQEADGTQFV